MPRWPTPKCQDCGKDLTLTGRNSALTKYCKSCVRKRDLEYNHQYYLRSLKNV